MRLTGKGNSNSHGARPVHPIITMITWCRTSRLSITLWVGMLASAARTAFAPERRPALRVSHTLSLSLSLSRSLSQTHPPTHTLSLFLSLSLTHTRGTRSEVRAAVRGGGGLVRQDVTHWGSGLRGARLEVGGVTSSARTAFASERRAALLVAESSANSSRVRSVVVRGCVESV